MTEEQTSTTAEPFKGSAPACRIYAIQARDGRSAVVFRRGPSRQVLVLRWWFDGDRLERGQWLKGRIYERRCDLSPNGDLLIYFAAKWETPMSTWTAVSRTPYLTALAVWPKGDAWGGGGLFDSSTTIGLNYFEVPDQTVLRKMADAEAAADERAGWHPLGAETAGKKKLKKQAAYNAVPSRFTVQRLAEWAGRGEDNPIEDARMVRDGWQHVQRGSMGKYGATNGYSWKFDPPEIMERDAVVSGHKGKNQLVLVRELIGIGQVDGPWYVENFIVREKDGAELRRIDNCSWADWHMHGDLLFAVASRLYRLPRAKTADAVTDPLDGAVLVADLADLRFTPTLAPDWALRWG